MNLSDCRFVHAGRTMGFTIFASSPVRVVLDQVFQMQMVGQAEVYKLEPTKQVRRISVRIKDGYKVINRHWIRRREQFEEVSVIQKAS